MCACDHLFTSVRPALLFPCPTIISLSDSQKTFGPVPLVFYSSTLTLHQSLSVLPFQIPATCLQMTSQQVFLPVPIPSPYRLPAVHRIFPLGYHPTCIHMFKIWTIRKQNKNEPQKSSSTEMSPFSVPDCCHEVVLYPKLVLLRLILTSFSFTEEAECYNGKSTGFDVAWFQTPAFSLTSFMTTVKLLNLCKHQFLHL